jgi:hypothetical protein
MTGNPTNFGLGNIWSTNISKKVELGNKKEKEKHSKAYEKQALGKQKKVTSQYKTAQI